MDYFRADCIKSYFEIVALVNKGNKIVNEQTEAKFFIADEKLYLGINSQQKIYLCKRVNYWLRGTNSGHTSLEMFICKVLNTNKIVSGNVDTLIKSELFKLSD